MFKHWQATDFVAIFIILGAFVFLCFEREGTFSGILTLIVGYYFGKKSGTLPEHSHATEQP